MATIRPPQGRAMMGCESREGCLLREVIPLHRNTPEV